MTKPDDKQLAEQSKVSTKLVVGVAVSFVFVNFFIFITYKIVHALAY